MRSTTDTDDPRIPAAVGEYVLGQKTLGEAADAAGMSRWEFREFLVDRGVQLRMGPKSVEDAISEVDVALGRDE